MYKRANISYPSNERELSKMTEFEVQQLIEVNKRTFNKSLELFESLTGQYNVVSYLNMMKPAIILNYKRSIKQSITSTEELLSILNVIRIDTERDTYMILMDINRNPQNGVVTLNIISDDIHLGRRYSVNLHIEPTGQYKASLSMGKSLRGR